LAEINKTAMEKINPKGSIIKVKSTGEEGELKKTHSKIKVLEKREVIRDIGRIKNIIENKKIEEIKGIDIVNIVKGEKTHF
jgi:hypothetical protein